MEKPIASILVAYDGSELSKKALRYAERMAKTDENITLHILTVKSLPVYTGIYTAPLFDQIEEDTVNMLENMLKEAKESITVANAVETHLVTGPAAEMIVEFANENHVDLIVMGSRGLGSVKELFLGSVSHHVVQTAKCPVFIIK